MARIGEKWADFLFIKSIGIEETIAVDFGKKKTIREFYLWVSGWYLANIDSYVEVPYTAVQLFELIILELIRELNLEFLPVGQFAIGHNSFFTHSSVKVKL